MLTAIAWEAYGPQFDGANLNEGRRARIVHYSEAFQRLGYELDVPRQDWTARNASGVCISLWKSEIRFQEGTSSYDTRNRDRDNVTWQQKPGHKKRGQHIAEAIQKYDGFVDVVIVDGITGESVEEAHPWLPATRKGYRWRITSFEPETGHFVAVAQPAT